MFILDKITHSFNFPLNTEFYDSFLYLLLSGKKLLKFLLILLLFNCGHNLKKKVLKQKLIMYILNISDVNLNFLSNILKWKLNLLLLLFVVFSLASSTFYLGKWRKTLNSF